MNYLVAVCASALALSIYPGVLEYDGIGSVVCFGLVFPPVSFPLFVWIGSKLGRQLVSDRPLARHELVLALTIPIATFVLVDREVPRQLAFAAARESFKAAVKSLPPTEAAGCGLGRRMGLFTSDHYSAKSGEGTYFRVYSTGHYCCDRSAFGFAYRPRKGDRPFGAQEVLLHRLDRDWHWFEAAGTSKQ